MRSDAPLFVLVISRYADRKDPLHVPRRAHIYRAIFHIPYVHLAIAAIVIKIDLATVGEIGTLLK